MARVKPERRTPIDIAVTIAIVVVLVVAGTLIWYASPARTTENITADAGAAYGPAQSVPESVVPLWYAPSESTDIPALSATNVLTGSQGAVTGRDPRSGEQVWLYQRTADLCALRMAWPGAGSQALAVYRNSRGCSEVTALDAGTGQRVGARTSDADANLSLITDDGYMLALGTTRLETWSSNMVRGIEYGRIEAPVRHGEQPIRTGCQFYSGAVGDNRIAIIERCDGDGGYRLTVLGATLDGDDNVRQHGSSLITDTLDAPPPRVIAMTTSAIAVYDGTTHDSGPQIQLFNTDGAPGADYQIAGPPQAPADSHALVSGGQVTFFTGEVTAVLDGQSLQPRYQVPNTLGPGEVMAGRLLLPSPGGASVLDAATGRTLSTLNYPRHDYDQNDHEGGVVTLRTLGQQIVEQRRDVVEVFGPQ